MKRAKDSRIPEFKSLEEEKEYWEARGPLAEGHKGRTNKPRPRQRRSSFLAVRLTGEELTRLRDLAATQGLGPSTFARIVLNSVIEQQSLPNHKTVDKLRDILEDNIPQSIKEQAERLLEETSLGDSDNPFARLFDRDQMNEWGELGLKAISILLATYGVQVVTDEHPNYKEINALVHSDE